MSTKRPWTNRFFTNVNQSNLSDEFQQNINLAILGEDALANARFCNEFIDSVHLTWFIPPSLHFNVKKIIYQALKPLVGLPLRHIGRSSNMLWLQFGDLHEVSNTDGSTKVVHDWTVQIQCAWRISQAGRIVLAFRDFFYSDVPLSNVAVINKNRSGSVLESLCAEFETPPPQVSSVEAEDTGNFSLHLSQNYHLEAFAEENTESGKYWRIFQSGVLGKSFVFPPSEM